MADTKNKALEQFIQTSTEMMVALMKQKPMAGLEAITNGEDFWSFRRFPPHDKFYSNRRAIFAIRKPRQGFSKCMNLFGRPAPFAFVAFCAQENGEVAGAVLSTRLRLAPPSRIGLHNGFLYNVTLGSFSAGTETHPMQPEKMAREIASLLLKAVS
ncbi:MAG: hypothetical protein AB7E52_04970 [Bdellovibrionales bacterium]